jgi:environmental stress-induced protein Ves
MKLVKLDLLPLQPWKNGGGVTSELAIDPADATAENFRWRISLARIAQDGPFSAFPGITRWITLIEGGGFTLDFDDGSRIDVPEPFVPHRFDGGRAAHCRLKGGPSRDLNVMARADVAMDVQVIAAGEGAPPPGFALVGADIVLVRLDAGRMLRAAVRA